ncbi:MAG: ATP-dependent 6-phosphofructokinase, partial [Chitinivibrionales bacterium]
MKIGILTAGGDCPGLNAAIRGISKIAVSEYNMDVYGFLSGFEGLAYGNYIEIKLGMLSGLLTSGGTILGASRLKPFKDETIPDKIKKTYQDMELNCLVCLGGNGTMKTAYKLTELGLNVIGLPKTIDNDVWGTDTTFGFDSALSIATESIDRLHTTANSHGRIMVIEVMGHKAGWLALYSGIAGGGDVILLPEINYSGKTVAEYLKKRNDLGKNYSIVVVAEGIHTSNKNKKKKAKYISKIIKEELDWNPRVTKLGYVQRGGTPTAYDRILATRYGSYAAD